MSGVDFLVVGGGIAGLRAAVRLAEAGRVLVVTKEGLAESNTAYAQGGIAVAMGGKQDVALHLEDTLGAGDGLVDRAAAEVLVTQGPARVEELLQWGTKFDRYAGGSHAGELMRTREGAHSLSRILHADGDATGREIAVSLLRHVRGLASVELLEHTTTVDLVVEHGRVVGVTLLGADGRVGEVRARAVLLASGGAGQVYRETTNPAVATGDGIAMAYRAGAELMDMEFYQFHPTAFALEGAPRFLISEAVRGEGAWLVNARGERFMERYHAGLELAPRDVVARAIAREMLEGAVSLDTRGQKTVADWQERFPGISGFLAGYGLALGRDLVPVAPAAHYLMGGVRTDVHGRTTVPGLFAAGEAACTGVHGANRLASNSLLEGLVFGALAAEAMVEEQGSGIRDQGSGGGGSGESGSGEAGSGEAGSGEAGSGETGSGETAADGENAGVAGWVAALRETMWHDAGLLRDRDGLERAGAALARMRATMPGGVTRAAVEARNVLGVAEVMVQAALAREESRGAHFRLDYTGKDAVARHSVVRQGELQCVPVG